MIGFKYLILSMVLVFSMILPQELVVYGEELDEQGALLVGDPSQNLSLEAEISSLTEQIDPEPIIINRNLSLYAEITPLKEVWTNGDVLRYEVYISNEGTESLSNVEVQDDWGLNEELGTLHPGESLTLDRSYRIDDYNMQEVISNSGYLSASFEGETIALNLDFSVDVIIPRGSITIVNSSRELNMSNDEFDFLVYGPMGSVYTISLLPGETGTIGNLFMGDYEVETIAPMYYEERSGEDKIELYIDDPNSTVIIECNAVKEAWFSGKCFGTISGERISSEDTLDEKTSHEYSDTRTGQIFVELEPIIFIPAPDPPSEEPLPEEPIMEEPMLEETIIELPALEDPAEVQVEESVNDQEAEYQAPDSVTIELDLPKELEITDDPIESEVLL